MQDNIRKMIEGFALSKAESIWNLEVDTLGRMAINQSILLFNTEKTHLLCAIENGAEKLYVDIAFVEDDQKPIYNWDMDIKSKNNPDKLMQEIFPEVQILHEGLNSNYLLPEGTINLDNSESNNLVFERDPENLRDLEHLGIVDDKPETKNGIKEEYIPTFKPLDKDAIDYADKEAQQD